MSDQHRDPTTIVAVDIARDLRKKLAHLDVVESEAVRVTIAASLLYDLRDIRVMTPIMLELMQYFVANGIGRPS